MAILFFDGFDRYTILKDFDRNYWSYEPLDIVDYEKYAFGGYSYNHSEDSYSAGSSEFMEYMTGYYSFYSPNGARLPSGIFRDNIENSFNGIYISGNSYPGFGSPPGFLSLHNLNIADPNLLAPITYVQLSGFSLPSSGQSFLSTRILGIETKDSSYHNSDKNGRFEYKHPLVAFCSGNTTGLLLSIIKTTGNHLSLIENKKMTIGLEVFQNNGISGIFDLNITNDLNKYRIRSLYSTVNGYTSGILNDRILLIDKNLSEGFDYEYGSESVPITPISRWCHFQFGIIQSGSDPYIQVKLDDIDLLSIPVDTNLSDKDLWDDKIYISGFDFNNIRFFNRTYNGSIQYATTNTENIGISRYYLYGAVTLLDDIVLSDGSGVPNTFLGSNTKVIPFTPGVSANTSTNGVYSDGLTEWSGNTSSTRLALKNLDGDNGKIFSSVSGAIAAVRYTNSNMMIPDSNSLFRMQTEDAIGGIKVYAQAKKEFLDSRYSVVLRTGISDPYSIDNKVFLDFETSSNNTIIDLSRNRYVFTKSVPEIELSNINKFGDKSLRLLSGQYLSTPSVELQNSLTLECWIKLSGLNNSLTLFHRFAPIGLTTISPNLVVSTGSISYNAFYSQFGTGQLVLRFPNSGIQDTDWHHVALVSDTSKVVVFLDGISGTSYSVFSNADLFGSNTSLTNSLYYWSSTSPYNNSIKNFTSSASLASLFTYISGNGYIDEYRITNTQRYNTNFIPPSAILTERDDYITIGDPQNITRTRYGKVYQFYEYVNPSTDSPWTTGLIANPSGFILGVKKL
jgi:hypothetical protein